MILILQRKKDKLFYNKTSYKWDRNIEKAKIFKRKCDLFLFLKQNKIWTFPDDVVTNIEDCNILSIEFKITAIQKKILDEYKNKQILDELEKN